MPLTGIAAAVGLIHRVIATRDRNRPEKVQNAHSEVPRAI